MGERTRHILKSQDKSHENTDATSANSLLFIGVAATKPKPDAGVKHYKSWLSVTKSPLKMDPKLAALCAPVTALGGGVNGHGAAYFRVFVNRHGTNAMLKGGIFPVGSTIVKEKLTGSPTNLKVELLTVMTKQHAGYDQAAGDWEFYVTDEDGVRMPAPAGLANCVSCHRDVRAPDYVFRSYLPATVSK